MFHDFLFLFLIQRKLRLMLSVCSLVSFNSKKKKKYLIFIFEIIIRNTTSNYFKKLFKLSFRKIKYNENTQASRMQVLSTGEISDMSLIIFQKFKAELSRTRSYLLQIKPILLNQFTSK